MPHSSLGFHTISLFLTLKKQETSQLIRDFRKYSHDTGLIQIYRVNGDDIELKEELQNDGTYKTIITRNKNLKITYYNEDRGIKWLIRYNTWNKDFQSYIIEATINPKILGGIHDYITAATYDDMPAATKNFNHIAQRISPILKNFDYYRLKRIDYCVNFNLNELVPGCDPKRIMRLIKRSNIPPHYEEWTEYDDTAHRTKSRPSSFYLINSSVNINCYNKYMQLQEKSQENEKRGLPPIPQAALDAAKGIVRFEVQCKYHKMYISSNRAEESGNHNYNKYETLLSYETCDNIIRYYYQKIIGTGDWWTLYHAVRHIEFQNYNQQKENRLIEAIQLINNNRSLAKAMIIYQDKELKAFKRAIKDLSSININPVTIPKEWGIRHIPNLLYAYYDKVQQESLEKQAREEILTGDFEEFVK